MDKKLEKILDADKPQEAPSTITSANLASAMRRLMANQDFQLLRGRWLSLRSELLEKGKDNPSKAAWNTLKGFDVAVLEAEYWASKEARSADLNRRTEELLANLVGTGEKK